MSIVPVSPTELIGEVCDRHPSARAQAIVVLISGELTLCGHCADLFNPNDSVISLMDSRIKECV